MGAETCRIAALCYLQVGTLEDSISKEYLRKYQCPCMLRFGLDIPLSCRARMRVDIDGLFKAIVLSEPSEGLRDDHQTKSPNLGLTLSLIPKTLLEESKSAPVGLRWRRPSISPG